MRLWDETGATPRSYALTPDLLWNVEYVNGVGDSYVRRVEAPSASAARWYLESDGYQVVSVEQIAAKKLI